MGLEFSMKLTKKNILAAAALCAAALGGTANAGPAVWTDFVDFVPDKLVVAYQPVIYTHTLEGFNSSTDTISSYSLKFDLYDDRDNAPETALFSQLGAVLPNSTNQFFNLSGTEGGGWTIAGRLQLQVTGSLTVAITSLLGDFYLGSSTLTVTGSKNSVPEPGTLALFGAALLGFGLVRRKAKAL
jgi:PEP-CTERM motif-containing protein